MPAHARRWAMAATALAMTLATAGSASALSRAPRSPDQEVTSVAGAGGGTLRSGSLAGDRVSFQVHGSAPNAKPWLAGGTFEVKHLKPDGTLLSHFGGDISCLMASNGVAVATGTVAWTRGPGLPNQDPSGVQVGLTIQDHGRRDQIGWSWWVSGFRDAPHCMSTAPFFPITEGNYRVDAPHGSP
jgi:hypothetical protein